LRAQNLGIGEVRHRIPRRCGQHLGDQRLGAFGDRVGRVGGNNVMNPESVCGTRLAWYPWRRTGLP